MAGPRLGIMGGTFDPIHYGHLLAAEASRVRLRLDQVLFVPTGQPWQKPVGVGAAGDRHAMTVLATASNPAFAVSRIELDHPGPTYTVQTLRHLRAELPEGTGLFHILGADAVLHLPTWKDPAEVLALAELVAVTRAGHDLRRLQATLDAVMGPDAPPGAAAARLHVVDIPDLAISSTEMRARVAAGESIRYLTPDPVVAYIDEHGLYRAGS
jgi:nicotinate-nucleotide adenylyltransferase